MAMAHAKKTWLQELQEVKRKLLQQFARATS
jgi:hypothetical protein